MTPVSMTLHLIKGMQTDSAGLHGLNVWRKYVQWAGFGGQILFLKSDNRLLVAHMKFELVQVKYIISLLAALSVCLTGLFIENCFLTLPTVCIL